MSLVRFDSLHLGDFFIVGDTVFEKLDDTVKRVVEGRRGGNFDPWDMVLPITIVTSATGCPLPVRNFDYSAVLADYEGGQPIGYGVSLRAAIVDLCADIEALVEGT